ncbi:MAG: hypothetical protein LQ350_005170 [Teloschistes chrysophthalmus]|nr:MAG: hypothetical protein LQ350_005170 [Niorma chrysophthalma]
MASTSTTDFEPFDDLEICCLAYFLGYGSRTEVLTDKMWKICTLMRCLPPAEKPSPQVFYENLRKITDETVRNASQLALSDKFKNMKLSPINRERCETVQKAPPGITLEPSKDVVFMYLKYPMGYEKAMEVREDDKAAQTARDGKGLQSGL